jgi:uncharacterized protein involved in exopolysaccharide biosynthesis
MTDTADWDPTGGFQADRGYAPVRPRLGLSDFLLQLWRAKWVMLGAAGPVLILGLLLAAQMPATYEAKAALYIASSEDRLAYATPVVEDEVQVLRTRLVAERTVSRFQISRLYPALSRAQQRAVAGARPGDAAAVEYRYFQRAVALFQASFHASVAERSNVIKVSVTHTDPEVATELLNAAIAAYINRRTELFPRGAGREWHVERKQAEGRLLEAEAAIRAFLDANSIRDFVSERATAQGLHAAVSNERVLAQSRQRAVAASLERTRAQMLETPQEIDLFVEDDRAQRLLALEIERNQALITYTPDSRRVQAIEQQIAELKSLLAAEDGPAGTVRRGPNPTYQALETTRYDLEAEAASLSEQIRELTRQLQAVEEKLTRFSTLEGEWHALQRSRMALETAVQDLGDRERGDPRQGNLADMVKITEPATVPVHGQSLKGPILAVTVLLALIVAVLFGFVRALSRRDFSTPGSLQRTTGLPVFGATGRV